MLTETSSNAVRFVITEESLLHHTETLREQMTASLREVAAGEVVLDLTQVATISSRGVGLIVGIWKSCLKKGLEFRVEVLPGKLTNLLKMCNLSGQIDIREIANE
jgi:anti-anti-sigma factor